MHEAPIPDPRQTQAQLGRAYWAFYEHTLADLKPQFLPWVDIADVEAVEAVARQTAGSEVSALHQKMLEKLQDLASNNTDVGREEFKGLYDQAVGLTLPATCAFLRHSHAIRAITSSHSLSAVDLNTLKSIDLLAHQDPTFRTFAKQLVAKLAKKTTEFDVIAYSQFFEIYGEAVTLQFLRDRGLKTERVAEADTGRPDFQCELESGKDFYIEVKSLDIVGGEFRHREMMEDALDVQIDLEAQLKSGERVAMAVSEISPYKGVGTTRSYDWRSLITVIDSLRSKCRQAFKSSQFTLGPTFALALLDRLVLPGAVHALAPYYYEPLHGGACISGVLWHAAYGKIGAPIFRICEFEGKPTLEGHLTSDGLFADTHQVFPGVGLITLDGRTGQRVAYGLAAANKTEGWSFDLTEEVLRLICDAQNDHGNSFAHVLSHREHGPRSQSPEA